MLTFPKSLHEFFHTRKNIGICAELLQPITKLISHVFHLFAHFCVALCTRLSRFDALLNLSEACGLQLCSITQGRNSIVAWFAPTNDFNAVVAHFRKCGVK